MSVLGVPIDVVDPRQALMRMAAWAMAKESRVVCACNVHSVVTAQNDSRFMAAIVQADLATADGAPVAWLMRQQGAKTQRRVCGPDLMWSYCSHAAAINEPIYLYGSTQATLLALQARLHKRWPSLLVAGAYAPPFRSLTEEEDIAVVEAINNSGARTVWVSLGCPKQELWMAQHRGRIHAVMVGVGAATDFHAGTLSRAPIWMQNNGLEWLFRLASEPRRLSRRYLTTNTAFLWAAARQWLGGKQTR